jgi:hypothetical protein
VIARTSTNIIKSLPKTWYHKLNEAIKRNRHRFPPDFMFQLTGEEFDSLKSQNAMSKAGRGGRRGFNEE